MAEALNEVDTSQPPAREVVTVHELQEPSHEELLSYVRSLPGTAPVKMEYIDLTKVSEKFCKSRDGQTTSAAGHDKRKKDADSNSGHPSKKQKFRGQNKRRPRDKRSLPGDRPCLDVLRGGDCAYGESCKYSHDVEKLMKDKPPDIGPRCYAFEQFGACQYGLLCRFGSSHIDGDNKNTVNKEKVQETGGKPTVLNVLSRDLQIRLRKKTVRFEKYDQYLMSIKTKRSSSNNQSSRQKIDAASASVKGLRNDIDPSMDRSKSTPALTGIHEESKTNTCKADAGETGLTPADADPLESLESAKGHEGGASIQTTTATPVNLEGKAEVSCNDNLANGQDAPLTHIIVDACMVTLSDSSTGRDGNNDNIPTGNHSEQDHPTIGGTAQEECSVILPSMDSSQGQTVKGVDRDCVAMATDDVQHSGAVTDADVIRLRANEKKMLDVENKLVLAPLTTVGNLPFRRVCKKFGADITCGEMAMCTNLLQGQTSEWALLKRHPTEDVFGVQLCGGYPDTMTKCAELLNRTIDVDFVDINVGCPIDLVYHKGAGSGLMNRLGKFQEIVRSMSSVLDIPLTVKMRTGVHEGRLIAHKLIPSIYQWGASVVTVHGRTREQRYTKFADWSYLKDCADAARPHPFIGNGDVLSYEDAKLFQELSGTSSLMIARGALMKPWIFTEIKEERHWDISSRERLDMLQDYVNQGLVHWGSDGEGVRRTRRFLLEWLSFLHRYIPVGVLERLPQKINERPPYFVGRDDLETLMASANCADWIKISEMFLGPTPDDFVFLPKHKANSYK